MIFNNSVTLVIKKANKCTYSHCDPSKEFQISTPKHTARLRTCYGQKQNG